MAKQAILDVLEKTIGKYVKNLDAQSLNVAVWKGQIHLNSLELNLDAINTELARQAAESPNLAIPFRVIDGGFESIQVDVPWSHITSQPVVLQAKGLKVVVEPYDTATSADYLVDADITEKKRIQNIHEQRLQSIQSADDYRQQANALRKLADEEISDNVTGGDAKKKATFTENLVRRIIENIQLDVIDVHISLKSTGSAAGVVLQSFSVFSTNKDGKREFVDRLKNAENFLYKVLQMTGLGVYLDETSVVSKPKSSLDETDHAQHSYILAPLSFEARLRQAASQKCIDYPKYLVQSELHQLSMLLSKTQLELGNKIAAAIAPSATASHPLFPEYRPLTRVTKESAKEWWRYAFRCVERLSGRGLWEDFFYAFKLRKQYIPLYKRSAHAENCAWLTSLSDDEKAQLDSIEQDRSISVEGIMSWRNIADAQFDREQKKHDEAEKKKTAGQGGIMASLFGSKTAQTDDSAGDGDPPISLSVEEMQELEAISLQQAEDAELSKDSKLYDIVFVLGSFKVGLDGHGAKQIAAFEMGTATTSFKANADGSYVFDSKLASMELQDKVTLKSLFPTVMRNIISADEVAGSEDNGVFRFTLNKSRAGDQDMTLRMAAFEIVASQMLLVEVKQFFSSSGSAQQGKLDNALLRQSLSGTVDLFYDANEGEEPTPAVDFSDETAAAKDKISETISSALVDAWKSKTEKKTKWTVNCDIHAPILVIPESCSSSEANVLVFDFGRFKVDYGTNHVAPKVKEWFDEQPGSGSDDTLIDPGSIVIKEMTFTIGKAGDFHWRKSTSSSEITDKLNQLTVIEPLSGTLNFGVLSDIQRDMPTVCAEGLVPVVGFAISPSQILKVLSVYSGWKPVVAAFTGQDTNEKSSDVQAKDAVGGVKIVEEDDGDGSLHEDDLAPSPIRRLSQMHRSSIFHSARTGLSGRKRKATVSDALTTMHVFMGLTRLSIRVSSDTGEGIEAHLVSVSASSSKKSDGSSVNRLCMGYFWILDRFNYDFPRRQRLVAHSTLPHSAAEYSKDDKYDVLHSLPLNVFDSHSSGSSELADILFSVRGSDSGLVLDANPFSDPDPLNDSAAADSILTAQFSSLYVHWNPQAVKVIAQAFSETVARLHDFAEKETMLQTPTNASDSPDVLHRSIQSLPQVDTDAEERRTTMMICANLKKLEIILDSAKDDQPLFNLTMSDTKMKMLSSQYEEANGTLISLGLGDIRIETPETSRTNPSYRTLLGLAPQQTESLLSVTFSMGEEAVKVCGMEDVDLSKCDMCGQITLSPMRLVYIQAQVMTLIEYITQGILGAVTAQAASSAAGAAVEMTQSSKGDQYFVVRATGFDVVVPESASSENSLKVQAGDLVVNYRGGPGGGEANLSLSDVWMQDNYSQRMVNDPMRMTVDVILPPPDVGTIDDRAMRITINFYQAQFLLTRSQYQGMMLMLAQNIGEPDPMLRDKPEDDITTEVTPAVVKDDDGSSSTTTKADESTTDITHGGVATVDVQNRMYMDFNLDILSLELCGDTTSDPIVHFAAVDATIQMQLLSDQDTMVVDAKLQDLTCDDRRLKAMNRPFRSLVSQTKSDDDEDDEDKSTGDLFCAQYKKIGDSSMEVDLKLGSPRIVFIPDVVSQILQFFQSPQTLDTEGPPPPRPPPREITQESEDQTNDGQDVVQVRVNEQEESIETAFVSLTQGSDSQNVTKMAFSIKTANCSVVLIDMGASVSSSGSQNKSLSQMTETIVLQGQFDAQSSLSSEKQSGRLVSARGELHGECMEIYTAHGSTFATPIQIVEPASVSLFISLSPVGTHAKNLDVRFVSLSPLEATFSTQNAALLNAIVSSCSECLASDQDDERSDAGMVPLSEQEASHVEALSSALQVSDEVRGDDSSVHTQRSVTDQSSHSIRSDNEDVISLITRVQVTMTETKLTLVNDLQGMDEALFRINASNFVAGAEVTQGIVESSGSMKETTFNIQVNTSFQADYFDSSVQLWKVLLKRPWEVTLKSSRERGHGSSSGRMSSIVDIEAYPCLVSFSEQFVVSLGAANKMWSIYSAATTKAIENESGSIDRNDLGASKKVLAESAARSLVSSLPYAIENHSGLDVHYLIPSSGERRTCQNGTMQFFRFEPPQGTGTGGQRRYGQDVTSQKAVTLFVQGKTIEIQDIDAEFSRPCQAHLLGEGRYLVSRASKDGKTKTLHLSSPVDVQNCTSVSFAVAVAIDGKDHNVGISSRNQGGPSDLASSVVFDERDGSTSKASKCFGIPIDLLSQEDKTTTLRISPQIDGGRVSGEVVLPSIREVVAHTGPGEATSRLDVTCKSPRDFSEKAHGARLPDPFSLQVRLKANLVDRKYPFIELFLEPRLILENAMPISVTLRTPMPHTFKAGANEKKSAGSTKEYETYHELSESELVEVYTPGPSIAISVKCADHPVGGTATDWMEGGWVDVPLVREFGLSEPIRCVFPFVRRTNNGQSVLGGPDGSEFFIAESGEDLNKVLRREDMYVNGDTSAHEDVDSPVELVEPKASTRRVLITVCNYAVDHTGDVLFEMVTEPNRNRRRSSSAVHGSIRSSSMAPVSYPFSAFASVHRRISLLPHQKVPMRLLHLTMEGDEGVRRSQPFLLDNISICDGGLDSTALNWEDNSESGFYAYRKLIDAYQFEVHVIPEFVVFNGSTMHRVLVKQQDSPGKLIEPGRVAPVKCIQNLGLVLSVDFIDLQASTAAMRVDVLGLRVAIVRDRDGSPLGSVAVQTVIGNQDSKFAVKLGELKFGSGTARDEAATPGQGMFDNDTVRFRIRWSEFQLTLNEARDMDSDDGDRTPSIQSALNNYIENQSPARSKASPRQRTWAEARAQSQEQLDIERQTQNPVCTIVLQRFTVDYQRIFKDNKATGNQSTRDILLSPERSQFSVIVHNVRLLDETPNSKFPVVFDSTSSTSFFDLCMRFRGSLKAELVKVDLVDLNLAHAHGKSEKIIIQTSEDFIWKSVDVANRIAVSTAQLAGVDLKMDWDEEQGEYTVSMKDMSTQTRDFDSEGTYTPPTSETLYDVNKARVSPFEVQVSFIRRPQSSRYKHLQNVRGAKLINYFTQKLKFKVDRADLKFSRYETSNVKGPPDQLIQILVAVYSQKMKYKVVSMLTAVSFEDWKNLASRDSGGDDFQDGDILRVTGNLAGGTAGLFARRVGGGLGTGINTVTSALGNEIEEATDMVGARALGAGVNSVVTGLGEGVGDTVKGVGTGTGKVLQGAGKGVGQIFGGVTGGATLMAKGIGKGIMQGDGKAVVSGFSRGAQSVGNGLGQGVESAVMGAADGVVTCGEGLATGVKSIGQGFASAFSGDCCACWGDSAAQDDD